MLIFCGRIKHLSMALKDFIVREVFLGGAPHLQVIIIDGLMGSDKSRSPPSQVL